MEYIKLQCISISNKFGKFERNPAGSDVNWSLNLIMTFSNFKFCEKSPFGRDDRSLNKNLIFFRFVSGSKASASIASILQKS